MRFPTHLVMRAGADSHHARPRHRLQGLHKVMAHPPRPQNAPGDGGDGVVTVCIRCMGLGTVCVKRRGAGRFDRRQIDGDGDVRTCSRGLALQIQWHRQRGRRRAALRPAVRAIAIAACQRERINQPNKSFNPVSRSANRKGSSDVCVCVMSQDLDATHKIESKYASRGALLPLMIDAAAAAAGAAPPGKNLFGYIM
jgi:hypothetical protein